MRGSRWTVIQLAALLFYALGAWSDARAQSGVLRGSVFDSIARRPLADAVLQVVRTDPGANEPARTVRSDSEGRFEIAGLAAGRYAVGFQHPVLIAVGLESPLVALEQGADTSSIRLFVPSAQTVRRLLCTDSHDIEHNALLMGSVQRIHGAGPVAGASIVLRWFEMTLVKGKLVTAAIDRTAITDDLGVFRICGLPDDTNVQLRVSDDGMRTVEGVVATALDDLWMHEIRLAPMTATTGTGVITGRVTAADGPLGAGRARIAALGIEAPIANGAFTLANLPEGTWIVDVTAIGYEAVQQWANVMEHTPTALRLVMAKKAQTLEAVNVVGKAGHDVKVLQGIQERSRVSAGTMILPGNWVLETALQPSDVVRVARGFTIKSETRVEGRPYMTAGGKLMPCQSRETDIPNNRRSTGEIDGKEVAVYVDGERWWGGLTTVNEALRAREILAAEAYPEVSSAPFLWRTNDACAVIAFWTKR